MKPTAGVITFHPNAADGNEVAGKQMCGCARSSARARFPLGSPSCMLEIAVPICFRSAEACQATQTHFLVRAFENRRIEPEEGRQSHLLDEVRAWPAQASRAFEVPASHGRTAHSTEVQLAVGVLSVLPPRFEKRCGKEPVRLWAIRVWEEHTPEGEEPLEWILVTSVPTMTLAQGCRARGMV